MRPDLDGWEVALAAERKQTREAERELDRARRLARGMSVAALFALAALVTALVACEEPEVVEGPSDPPSGGGLLLDVPPGGGG